MPVRVLRFPDDMSVGQVHASVAGRWVVSTPASGAVCVPYDAWVSLTFDLPARGLAALYPDEVQAAQPSMKKTATDADLAQLAPLTGLRDLYLSKALDVTDAGVAALAGMRRMRELDLYWTRVTDAGLVHLAGMVELESLHLGLTQVKGPGICHLLWLQRLRRLSLEDTDIGDEVVPWLARLSGLRTLVVSGTRLSVKGLNALRAALPEASIVMREPGRRLARELAREAVLRILARRLWPSLPAHASVTEALRGLLPVGSRIAQCRPEGSESHDCSLPFEDLDRAALVLAALRGSDLRVVTPGGRDEWIPWLKRRGDRRRSGRRRGATARSSRGELAAVPAFLG